MSSRRPLVAGNWKMHNDVPASVELARSVDLAVQALPNAEGVDVAVIPSFVALTAVATALRMSSIAVGAQNMHWEERGAFTGEVSPTMLRGVCSHVVLGHSERRHVFGETDEIIGLKAASALAHALNPIICVGETLDEHDADQTQEVVERQLTAALRDCGEEACLFAAVAYEPVWAIGTGRAASPDHADRVGQYLRTLLERRFGAPGLAIRILYGGSVTPENADELMTREGVDGALVGGASLRAESFAAIVAAARG